MEPNKNEQESTKTKEVKNKLNEIKNLSKLINFIIIKFKFLN